ncbi:LysR substrate-binding domain-containing protein [Simiduia sp. 21SJ11W-1]|uniref:LysR substrate-binding domain-containing protein n=1 Tax=Simiduia sp. 21SJ11W-1 TaxID=2909669 RepID=UPI0020A1E243|nr:LysR substrate-binding domain-containing protein [Simiduia sp. 21SJ11W-1]UTA48911.1 LysR substrate-binding domain-containing protein [Simiduia sp. 21SJ11W-1]
MITLEALQVLDAIDRKGSFAGAAAELHRVPSALSYTVKQLEAYLQLELFDRTGQRAVMTEAGRQVLKRARRLLEGAEQLTVEARQLATGWEPRLRLVVESILPMGPLWPVIARFSELHPGIEIDVSEQTMTGSWEALADQRADLLIGVPATEPAGVNASKAPLGEFCSQLVCAPSHPLALMAPGELTDEALKQFAQIVLRDSARRLPPRSVGLFAAKRQILVDHYYAKEQAILSGLGFGQLPKLRIQPYLDSGALVPLDAIVPLHGVMLYLAWDETRAGRGVRWFVETLGGERIFEDFLLSAARAR